MRGYPVKISIEKFKSILKDKGILIKNITKNDVDLLEIDNIPYDIKSRLLPQKHDRDVVIDGNWTVLYKGHDIKLWDLIQPSDFENPHIPLIHIIKCIRENTHIPLKDAKDIYDENKNIWMHYPDMRKVEFTPLEDLPLIINDIKSPKAKEYLKSKLTKAV